MRKVGMTALRRGLGRVIEKIDGGEVFLVTKKGEPCFLGLDVETYLDLPTYVSWGVSEDLSAFQFRREMSALADEQWDVVCVHYNPSSQVSYKAIFLPPWMARGAADEFGSPLREVIEGAREPERWRPGVEIWKSNRFRFNVRDGINEAREGVLGIEKRGRLRAYVVGMEVARCYLKFLRFEWEGRDKCFPSYEEWDHLGSLVKEMGLKPPSIPRRLAEGVSIKELTTTELKERYREVCEDEGTVYVISRYATPVCMVFPVKFYRALWRFVYLWRNSFDDLVGLAGKAKWALGEFYEGD